MSGNTLINLSDFSDCNDSKKDANGISQKCCDFHEVTFDFDYDTEIDLKEISVFNPLSLVLELNPILYQSNFQPLDFNFYTNLPPPSGYELLKVVQVFRL